MKRYDATSRGIENAQTSDVMCICELTLIHLRNTDLLIGS